MKPPDRHILRCLQTIDRTENNGQPFYPEPKPGMERKCYNHAMQMEYFITIPDEVPRRRIDADGQGVVEVRIRGVSRVGFQHMDRIRWLW